MTMHINLTIMILFVNIFLSLGAPATVLGDNPFFEENSQGDFVVKQEFQQRLSDANPAENEGFLDTAANVFSGLFLVFDFIGLLFKILFSSLIIVFTLPTTMALIVGVPVFIAYGLALIGFIRSG